MAPKGKKATTAADLSPEAQKEFNEIAQEKDEVFTLRPNLSDAALKELSQKRDEVAEKARKFSAEHFG